VHGRFQAWREAGVFRKLWQAGLVEFDANIGIDWEWQAMDGAMTKAPLGGGGEPAPTRRTEAPAEPHPGRVPRFGSPGGPPSRAR
jgi:hypothetical protein